MTVNAWVPTARLAYVTGEVQGAGAPPSIEHETAVAFVTANEKVAEVDAVVEAGPERMFTVGGGVTIHGYEALVESEPELAVTVNMCGPAAMFEYVIGVVHGAGVPESSEHETADVFLAEKENEADADEVVVPGPELIVTEGAGPGGGGGGGTGDEAVTVQVTNACVEPLALATRIARMWVPAERAVSVVGDAQAHAGGLLSSAQVVVVAPCDVHANVAVVADVVAGGCWTTVTVGSSADDETAA